MSSAHEGGPLLRFLLLKVETVTQDGAEVTWILAGVKVSAALVLLAWMLT